MLQLSHRSILLVFIFILLFCRAVAIAVSSLLFSQLGLPCCSSLLSAIFNSSCHFYCHTILIAAVYFIAIQPAISRQGWTLSCCFLLWPCCRHIHFAAKDFVVTTSCRHVFFCFSGSRSSRHFHAVMLLLLSLFNL